MFWEGSCGIGIVENLRSARFFSLWKRVFSIRPSGFKSRRGRLSCFFVGKRLQEPVNHRGFCGTKDTSGRVRDTPREEHALQSLALLIRTIRSGYGESAAPSSLRDSK